jgi:hypothetical protein
LWTFKRSIIKKLFNSIKYTSGGNPMKQLKKLVLLTIVSTCLLIGCSGGGDDSSSNPAAVTAPTQLASAQEISDNIAGTWRMAGSSTTDSGDTTITMQEYTFNDSGTMIAQADVYSATLGKQFWDGFTKFQVLDGKIKTFDGTVKMYEVDSQGNKDFFMEISVEDSEQIVAEIDSQKMVQFNAKEQKYETYYKQATAANNK